MKTLATVALLFAGALLVSCEVSPEPINYGTEACHFCRMTIVDQQHAAQYVTKKGKQFKFDAVECMLNQLSETGMADLEILLVCDYTQPGQMTDATRASYLISPQIKSPMGANLSAFSKLSDAEETLGVRGGELFDWSEMLTKYQVTE